METSGSPGAAGRSGLRPAGLFWALLLVAGAALLVAGLWPREPDDDSAWDAPDTTFSPGPRGTKALFLLLSQEGLPVSRLRRPSYDRLPPRAALWDLSPERLGPLERRWLAGFVRAGGTFVGGPGPVRDLAAEAGLPGPEFLEKEGAVEEPGGLDVQVERSWSIAGLGVPARVDLRREEKTPVVADFPLGRGRIVFVGITAAVRDDQIGRGDNGPFFARLARRTGSPLFFDEFQTGFGDEGLARLLASAPYRWGLLQGALALVLGLLGLFARREVARAADPPRRRRTDDQVAALARLWRQGDDAGLPLGVLLSAAAERARGRLSGAGGFEPFPEWVAVVRPELAERARDLWSRAAALAGRARPPAGRARQAAAEVLELEKEVLAW